MTIPGNIFSKVLNWPGTAWGTLTMVSAEEGGGGAPGASYDDSELKSFATAAVKVQSISDAYSQKMGAVQSEAEKKQLQRKASLEMVEAVKKEGMTVDKYQSIAKRLDTDVELAKRVRQKLSEAA